MNLYLVKMHSDDGSEIFYKVGVTNSSVKERFSYGKTKVLESNELSMMELERSLAGKVYISDHPYDVEEIHVVSYKYEGDALLAEQALLEVLKPNQYWPKIDFSGKSECFNGDSLDKLIIEFMNEDSINRNREAPSELKYKLAETKADRREKDPIKRHLQILKICTEYF